MKWTIRFFFILLFNKSTASFCQQFKSIGISVGVKNALLNQYYSEKYLKSISLLDNYFQSSFYQRKKYENHYLNYYYSPTPLYLINYSQISFAANDTLYYKPSILNINQSDSLHEITVSFSKCEGVNNSISHILLVYIDSSNTKLINTTAVNLKRQDWQIIEKEFTRVYWSKKLKCKYSEIENLEKFHKSIALKFNLNPIKINYIVGESKQEIKDLRGVIFQLNNSADAYAEIPTNTIYVTNKDFNCIHEFVHIYNHIAYPEIKPLFDEGMAVYWGNYQQKSLEEILPFLRNFVKNNQNINLADFNSLTSIYLSNNYGNLFYIIGGFLCKITEERHGKNSLKNLLSYNDEYLAIEHILGVKKENINNFLRKELEKY